MENDSNLICGEAVIKEIQVEDGCTKFCKRRYMFYAPKAACLQHDNDADNDKDSFSTNTAGSGIKHTLPLVFSVHCLGGSLDTLSFWTKIAEEYNFVWVNPEGIERSFNAGDESCCGYALTNGIDDYAFFKAIIHNEVSSMQRYANNSIVLSTDLVHAMGWSNGGYMVSFAAPLFRAIAPISGYQVKPLSMDFPKPTGIFLHHSKDDRMVQFTGCCNDPTMPKCCCSISDRMMNQSPCMSVPQKMQEWAIHFNGCTTTTNTSTNIQDTYYHGYHNTNQSQLSHIANQQITMQTDDVTCYTFENCVANTTYCVHTDNKGHFNFQQRFEQAFPMHYEIAEFFARDACTIHGGTWRISASSLSSSTSTSHPQQQPTSSRCTCQSPYYGMYCFDMVGGTTILAPTLAQQQQQPKGILSNTPEETTVWNIPYRDKGGSNTGITELSRLSKESFDVHMTILVVVLAMGYCLWYGRVRRRPQHRRYGGVDPYRRVTTATITASRTS